MYRRQVWIISNANAGVLESRENKSVRLTCGVEVKQMFGSNKKKVEETIVPATGFDPVTSPL